VTYLEGEFMSNLGTRVQYDPLRTIAFGAIGAAYANVGTPFDYPAPQIIIQNNTDADMMFSFYSGINHMPLRAYESIVLDYASNKALSAGWYLPEHTQMQVKQRTGAPTLGTVDITVSYNAVL
jgi:hypothetical protein